MQTVWDHIRLATDRTPGNIAVVDDQSGRQLTYADLVAEVESTAAGLRAAGLRRGQRFATALPNVLEQIFALLALHRLGTVVCIINPRLKPEEAAQLMHDAGAAGVVCLPDAEILAAGRDALPQDAPVLAVGERVEGVSPFESCRADANDLPDWTPPNPEDIAFVLYTSGTTGLPKGVMTPTGRPMAACCLRQCNADFGTVRRIVRWD